VLDRRFLSRYMENYVAIVDIWLPDPGSSPSEVIAIDDFLNWSSSQVVTAGSRVGRSLTNGSSRSDIMDQTPNHTGKKDLVR
jgi:hypothetical protein